MRFNKLKRRSEIKKGQLDIAPFITIVFQLLIFFMLTSNFVLQPGIPVSLPKTVTSEVLSSENFAITLSGQGLLYLNDTPITIGDLAAKLKESARENRAVLLRADADVSLSRVMEIWDLCRELGVSQINIATNQKPGGLV
jgi:biopolymer transport protein ExbD